MNALDPLARQLFKVHGGARPCPAENHIIRLAKAQASRSRFTNGIGWEPREPTQIIRPITGHTVLRLVAKLSPYSLAALKSHRRPADLVRWRHIAVWLMIKHCPHLSLPQIGAIIGGRDHSTIINSKRRVEAELERFTQDIDSADLFIRTYMEAVS